MDWTQLVLFALLGLAPGALIAGIALGVVLTYRGSGIINLATGSVAMVAGYLFYSFRTQIFGTGLPTAASMILAVAAAILMGLLMELLAFRPLRGAGAR